MIYKPVLTNDRDFKKRKRLVMLTKKWTILTFLSFLTNTASTRKISFVKDARPSFCCQVKGSVRKMR